MPDLRTITGVELARLGTYDLSTGPYEFTEADLQSAIVNAATGTKPRVKLGHIDPRFDAEPAIGVVTNLRLNTEGDALLGDLANVPGWLADALPAAYPGRSIEASVTPESGMRITALALLGMTRPGIDSLADLELALAAAARDRPADPDVTQVALAMTQLRASVAQDPPAASRPDNERNHPMDESVLKALAAKYGLNPDVATEEQVNAAVLAAVESPADPTPEPEPVAVTDPPAEPAEPAPAEPVAQEESPLAVAASAAIETLSTEVAELRAAAAEREKQETADRRDLLASTWLGEGRITLAEKPHYRGLLDIDEAGTVKLAASLAAGRVPVGVPVTTHTLAAASDGEPTTTGWFPRLNQEA